MTDNVPLIALFGHRRAQRMDVATLARSLNAARWDWTVEGVARDLTAWGWSQTRLTPIGPVESRTFRKPDAPICHVSANSRGVYRVAFTLGWVRLTDLPELVRPAAEYQVGVEYERHLAALRAALGPEAFERPPAADEPGLLVPEEYARLARWVLPGARVSLLWFTSVHDPDAPPERGVQVEAEPPAGGEAEPGAAPDRC